jgi:hypothetical protein
MKENFLTILTAATGGAASEVAAAITEQQSPEIIQIVVQILIGVATLWKLLRKKKDNTTPEVK